MCAPIQNQNHGSVLVGLKQRGRGGYGVLLVTITREGILTGFLRIVEFGFRLVRNDDGGKG